MLDQRARAAELDEPYALAGDDLAVFDERGWLFLEGLLSPDLAGTLAAECLEWSSTHRTIDAAPLDAAANNHATSLEIQRQHVLYNNIDRDSPAFRDAVLSRRVGSIASQLLRCDPVQFFRSSVFSKLPSRDGGGPTSLHQDFPFTPFDRSRSLTLWIALVDLTEDMGPLRFVDGSSRFGVLGRDELYRPESDYIARRSEEEGWQLSAPRAMRAGDATVHADLTLHGADANVGDRPRLGWSVYYLDPATLYTGAPSSHVDEYGLVPNRPFDPQHFPLVEVGR